MFDKGSRLYDTYVDLRRFHSILEYIDMYSILNNSSVLYQMVAIFVRILRTCKQFTNSLLEFIPILYKITAHLRECVS